MFDADVFVARGFGKLACLRKHKRRVARQITFARARAGYGREGRQYFVGFSQKCVGIGAALRYELRDKSVFVGKKGVNDMFRKQLLMMSFKRNVLRVVYCVKRFFSVFTKIHKSYLL